MLVLALVWWAWSAFVWAANAEQEQSRVLRGVSLLGMVFIFIVGLSLPRAFGDRGHAVRLQLRRRSLAPPGPLRTRVETWQRLVVGDRWVRHDGRDRHGASHCRFVSRRRDTGLGLDFGGGDRLRGPRVAHSRAPSRPATGGCGSLRRALRPVRDHLPR